jgi:predicted ribosomally synthesized peptide with SipW-like signal peptide
MRRRFSRPVVFALLATMLWLGFVVDGTHALFSDQVQLTGNTISSGTADLLISNSQNSSSTIFEDTRPGFALDLSPGGSQEKYFLLKNSNESSVDLRISLDADLIGNDPTGMVGYISFAFIEVDGSGTPIGQGVTTTLPALLQSGQVSSDFVVPQGQTRRFRMTTTMDAAYTEQSAGISYDLRFIGTQLLGG